MWSYLTWTSPGVPRRRSVWAPPPSPALGTKLSHKHNHTLATPGLQLCASHRREMGKTLHQGDRINLITNRFAKASLTPAVPGRDWSCWFTPKHIETPHSNGRFMEWNRLCLRTRVVFSPLISRFYIILSVKYAQSLKSPSKTIHLSWLRWFHLILNFKLHLSRSSDLKWDFLL